MQRWIWWFWKQNIHYLFKIHVKFNRIETKHLGDLCLRTTCMYPECQWTCTTIQYAVMKSRTTRRTRFGHQSAFDIWYLIQTQTRFDFRFDYNLGTPLSPISLIFMQFAAQFLANNRLVPPPLGMTFPSGKLLIRHWISLFQLKNSDLPFHVSIVWMFAFIDRTWRDQFMVPLPLYNPVFIIVIYGW